MIIYIKSPQDRRFISGILIDNGYKVEIVKVKQGKTTKTAIRADRKDKEEIITDERD